MRRIRDGDETRELILEDIRNHPGTSKSDVCRRLHLAWGTVSYHLEVLRSKRSIRLFNRGRERCVFPSGVPEQHMRWMAALRDAPGPDILRELKREPGQGIGDLASAVGASRKLVRKHLTELGEEGLVRQRGARRPQYHVEDGRIEAVEELGLLSDEP